MEAVSRSSSPSDEEAMVITVGCRIRRAVRVVGVTPTAVAVLVVFVIAEEESWTGLFELTEGGRG